MRMFLGDGFQGPHHRYRKPRQPTPKAFAELFKPYPYEKHLFQMMEAIEKGTSQWLFQNPAVKDWRSGTDCNILWLTGSPGMGKTSLIANFATSYSAYFNEELQDTVAALFCLCDSRDPENNDLGKILCVAIHQFLQHRRSKEKFNYDLAKYIQDEYRSELGVGQSQSFWHLPKDRLWKIFCDLCLESNLKTIFLLIDGVDECELDTQKELLSLLGQRSQLPSNLRVLISSQPIEAVRTHISKNPKFQIQHLDLHDEDHRVDDDINRYIDEQLDRLVPLRGYSNEQTDKIKEYLKASKCGLFLPIVLVIQRLENSNTRDVDTILRDLDDLRDLDKYYEVQLHRLSSVIANKPSKLLSTMLYSYRPLKVSELAHLCEYTNEQEPRTPNNSQEQLLPHNDLRNDLRFLAPFLRIRSSDDMVQFTHSSVQVFLLKRGQSTDSLDTDMISPPSDGHRDLAAACLEIIVDNIETIKAEFPYSWKDQRNAQIRSFMESHVLLAYACGYWNTHLKEISHVKVEDIHGVEELFAQLSQHWANDETGLLHVFLSQSLNRRKRLAVQSQSILAEEMKQLAKVGSACHMPLIWRSPFIFYVRFGNERLLRSFHQQQSENMPLQMYRSYDISVILTVATRNGDLSLMKALVNDYGVRNLQLKELSGLFHIASQTGSSELVRYLREMRSLIVTENPQNLVIAEQSDIIRPGTHTPETIPPIDIEEFRDSLVTALLENNQEVLDELLKLQRPNAKNLHGQNVLMSIAYHAGNIQLQSQDLIKLARILKRRGLDFNARDKMGNTFLHHLAWNSSLGTLESFKWFIDQGANPKISNNGGCLPIHLAAHRLHCECVKFLLSATKNYSPGSIWLQQIQSPSSTYYKSSGGLTPLHWVASRSISGRDEETVIDILDVLLDWGFRLTDRTRWGRTVISICRESPETFCLLMCMESSRTLLQNTGTTFGLETALIEYGNASECIDDYQIEFHETNELPSESSPNSGEMSTLNSPQADPVEEQEKKPHDKAPRNCFPCSAFSLLHKILYSSRDR